MTRREPKPIKQMSEPPNNAFDARIIRREVPRFRLLRWLGARKLLRAFVNRARERGYLSSYAFHELHALIQRILP